MAIGHPYDRSRAFAESPITGGFKRLFRIYMEKNTKQFMDLNRETAMRLWAKAFGKDTRAVDYAGRVIAKGAYGDRNSEFGWNVDHILPQSKGGTTADHNLICCHILTNDEKADRFPAFVANGRRFEIIKVQSHYEIRAIDERPKPANEEDDGDVNYYDAAAGIRFFKQLKGIQNKARFVGSVMVRLKNVANTAVVDFIEKVFDEESVLFDLDETYRESETRVIARNFDIPLKDDISALLDKCVLLNTYLAYYFVPKEYVDAYEICFRVDHYKEKTDMYVGAKRIDFPRVHDSFDNTVYINGLVVENTVAKERIEREGQYAWWNYNYINKKLSQDLGKEVSGK